MAMYGRREKSPSQRFPATKFRDVARDHEPFTQSNLPFFNEPLEVLFCFPVLAFPHQNPSRGMIFRCLVVLETHWALMVSSTLPCFRWSVSISWVSKRPALWCTAFSTGLASFMYIEKIDSSPTRTSTRLNKRFSQMQRISADLIRVLQADKFRTHSVLLNY